MASGEGGIASIDKHEIFKYASNAAKNTLSQNSGKE
jgi:hypothetical protein